MQDEPYREIPLRARDGSIRAVAKVSPEDFDGLNAFKWNLSNNGYAKRTYAKRGGGWGLDLLHRVVMGLPKGSEIQVDHINRDKLDNRRSNLRVVTESEQRQNVPGRPGTSAYRGVCRQGNKWGAYISTRWIGTWPTELEAAAAARAARILLMPKSPD